MQTRVEGMAAVWVVANGQSFRKVGKVCEERWVDERASLDLVRSRPVYLTGRASQAAVQTAHVLGLPRRVADTDRPSCIAGCLTSQRHHLRVSAGHLSRQAGRGPHGLHAAGRRPC